MGLAKALDFVRRFIRRRWKLIALTTVLGVALAIASLALAPLRYNAVATILLENQRVNLFPNQSVVNEVSLKTNAGIEGQLEVLRSDAISRAVIKKLNLENDPDFAIAPLVEIFDKYRTIRRLGPSLDIEVGLQSRNAARAAQVANAVVETYIADILASRRNAAHDAGGWLRGRLAELRTQVAEAESAVVDFTATR